MHWQEYLDYCHQMIGKKIGWTIREPTAEIQDGIVRAGYPLYDQQLLDFVRAFRQSKFYGPHYRRTLRHGHIRRVINHETIGQVMLSGDNHLVAAMLSLIIDNEDMTRGTWAAALQEGYMYQLLNEILNTPSTHVEEGQ